MSHVAELAGRDVAPPVDRQPGEAAVERCKAQPRACGQLQGPATGT